MAKENHSFDLIDIEVHQKSIRNVANEMGITLMRTSGSPVVTEAKDFSTCILDAEGEQLAFSGYVTFHISTAVLGVQAVLRNTSVAELRPGDVFICNDPHTSGAIHQGDIGAVMPFFYKDELVGWGYVNEHLLDVGGSSVSGFAPGAHDSFSEALAFPAVRIGRAGIIDPQWERFIANNVRMPDIVLNDIRSLIAANNAGQKRYHDLIDEVGLDNLKKLNDAGKDISEKAVRHIISAIPDGTYESQDWIEDDLHRAEKLHNIKCRLVVDGDEMIIQYRGDEQTDSFVNGAVPAVVGNSLSTLVNKLFYSIPINAGIWRPIHFDLGPKGSVVNSQSPAPVSQAHMECGERVNKALLDALSQACALSTDDVVSGRVAAQSAQNLAFFTAYGIDSRTNQPILAFPNSLGMPCGGGAQTVCDGIDTYAAEAMVGCDVPDVEIEEVNLPGIILWRRVRPDTGGAGYHRGGMGVEGAFVQLHSLRMTGGAYNSCAQIPPRGASGGFPGAAGIWNLYRDTNVLELLEKGALPTDDNFEGSREVMPNKTGDLVILLGDVFHVINGGGGGVGDPLLRPPSWVQKDIFDGYVSEEAACKLYGVILTNGEVNLEATESERLRIRSERIGKAPEREINANARFYSPLRASGDKWECNFCGQPLGKASENWRFSAVSIESDLADRFEQWCSQVRRVTSVKKSVVVENYCPGCASSLAVDVSLEGEETVSAPRLGVKEFFADYADALYGKTA